MPIDFKEAAPEKNSGKGSPGHSRPSHGAQPLQLDGQVLPQLIRKVGDWKSGRISLGMIQEYLDRHTLIFDRELLQKMVTEADYKKEGSLDSRALIAAISGRFPKREHTQDWRTLVALLLGLPDLYLAEDDPPVSRQGTQRTEGSFNSDTAWTDAYPPLPPVTRRRRAKSAEASGEWKALSCSGVLQAPCTSNNLTIRTTGGLKQASQIDAEQKVNSELAGPAARCTFKSTQQFSDFSKGLEVAAQLGVDTASGFGSSSSGRTAGFVGTPKTSVRAWTASLPPTAISLNTSALHTLRASVRNTQASKPDFARTHRSLDSSELDLKKTLGQNMDVDISLSRVEPVRGTKVNYNASYTEWSDYASGCRTAPTRWFNEHPAVAAAVQAAGDHKYPWC